MTTSHSTSSGSPAQAWSSPWEAGAAAPIRASVGAHADAHSSTEDDPPPTSAGTDHTIGVSLATVAVVGILLTPWLLRLPPLQAALCFAQVTIAAAGAARSAYPAVRPVALVTFIFTFSWLGIAPIYQLAHGKAAWQDSAVLYGPFTDTALGLMVLSTAALYLGFFRFESAAGKARPRTAATVVDPSRAICAGYVLASAVLTPRAVAASGGLSNMFSSRLDRSEALSAQGLVLSEVGGLQLALVGILPGALATAGCYLALIRVLNQFRREGLGQIAAPDAGILLLGFALVVVLANPFVNTRALSAAALGCLVLLIMRPRSRRAGALLTAGLLVATLVAYPAANAFRGTTDIYRTEGFEFLATLDFDGFQQVINTVDYVEERGYAFGSYSLSGAMYFVPRAIWPDKERPASIDVATDRGYVFTNLSLPIPAEMYLDFGPVGMVGAMFLLASAGRRCDQDWSAGVWSRAALMAPYACLACLSIIRGPIGANGPVFLTNLGLIGLGLLLARSGGSSSPEPPSHRALGTQRHNVYPGRRWK